MKNNNVFSDVLMEVNSRGCCSNVLQIMHNNLLLAKIIDSNVKIHCVVRTCYPWLMTKPRMVDKMCVFSVLSYFV